MHWAECAGSLHRSDPETCGQKHGNFFFLENQGLWLELPSPFELAGAVCFLYRKSQKIQMKWPPAKVGPRICWRSFAILPLPPFRRGGAKWQSFVSSCKFFGYPIVFCKSNISAWGSPGAKCLHGLGLNEIVRAEPKRDPHTQFQDEC